MTPTEKRCPKCRRVKGASLFNKDRKARTGLASYCRACSKAYGKARTASNPGLSRDYNLRKKYGITLEEYDAMLAEQGGGCAICGVFHETPGLMHVDHCHKDGHVRGILCGTCNQGLGLFYDDQIKLTEAIIYLRRTKKKK